MSNHEHMNLADIYRLADVKRWQIVKIAKPQSVAEHSYGVAMIGGRICHLLGMPLEIYRSVLEWALWHDAPEVYTGDIATPIKKHMRKVCDGDPLSGLEDYLCGQHYRGIKRNATEVQPEVALIVKLADLLESIKFLSQNGATEHSTKVRVKLSAAVQDRISHASKEYPEYLWSKVEDLLKLELLGPETTVDDLL